MQPHLYTHPAIPLTQTCQMYVWLFAGQVVWRIGEEWVGVPLARELHGNGHPFLLYPHHPILPSLGFPGKKKFLTLGWNRHRARLHAFTSRGVPTIATRENAMPESPTNTHATAMLQPLPPSKAYLMRLVCKGVGVAGKAVLCQLKVSAGGATLCYFYD